MMQQESFTLIWRAIISAPVKL